MAKGFYKGMSRTKDNYEPLSPEDPKHGGVFFDQVLERFGLDLNSPESQLLINWERIVGSDMAEHSRFSGIRDNVLYVICDHPSRAACMRLNGREIIKTINGIYPELDLRKVATRIGKK